MHTYMYMYIHIPMYIGSWLPCTKAVIGLTDRIMTRITSFESVAAAQSSFSLDLGTYV
jgi:DNA mismatch repair protein MSH5